MTTTELIKILQDNETGAISLKPREISLTINGIYMPNPQITLSSTGDGICGAEIDLDVCGEWLEQEPCEDAISRQAVRHILNHEIKMPIKVWKKLFELVDDLPPITPQPKTGHWIISPNDCFVHCSECGLHGDKGIYKHYGWCPNCGAKMVEPQESEK